MNTARTKRLVDENGVITLRADKTGHAPEVDRLLVELGNSHRNIPYLAIYPAGGGSPIILDGLIKQESVLMTLKRAGRSKSLDRMAKEEE